jgi:hypothetical protein
MILASRFCSILAVAATIFAFGALETIQYFDYLSSSHGSHWDWVSTMGDWVVCVVFIGGGLGALAWCKVWVDSPSFNAGT